MVSSRDGPHNSAMEPVIKRNGMIPYKWSCFVSTISDYQTVVNLRVFESDSDMTDDCHLLGELKLSGIQPAPRGKTDIEISFVIDANGILDVTADEKGIGICNHILITNVKGRLSKADIGRMISDASKYEEQVEQQRERDEAKNALENSINSLENNMNYTVVSMDKDKIMKAIIEEAIGDAWCLVHNEVATVKEYDQKKEHPQWLYHLILKWIGQRRVEAKNMLEDYITFIKEKISDPKVTERLDKRDKSVINQDVEDTEDRLKNNPGAREEMYEHYKEGIERTCTTIMSFV